MVDKKSGVSMAIGFMKSTFVEHDVKHICVMSHLSEEPGLFFEY